MDQVPYGRWLRVYSFLGCWSASDLPTRAQGAGPAKLKAGMCVLALLQQLSWSCYCTSAIWLLPSEAMNQPCAAVRCAMQYKSLLNDPGVQAALARYCQPDTLVVLVPPFKATESTIDDGVRMVSTPDEAHALMRCMLGVMREAGVQCHVLAATEKVARVAEVVKELLQ